VTSLGGGKCRSSERHFARTVHSCPYSLLERCLALVDLVELRLWQFLYQVECGHPVRTVELTPSGFCMVTKAFGKQASSFRPGLRNPFLRTCIECALLHSGNEVRHVIARFRGQSAKLAPNLLLFLRDVFRPRKRATAKQARSNDDY